MINIFFCSDHHLGHSNILEFEKEHRPFSNLDEMREEIIKRHNAVVKPNDIVYFLGDFAFGKHNIDHASRFNGKKKLILGNHDCYDSLHYLLYFEKLYGMIFWKDCILSHMPVHMDDHSSRWWLNVHGHLHANNVNRWFYDTFQLQTDDGLMTMMRSDTATKIIDLNYFNVSLEQNNLTPIHADVILDRVRELKA